MADLKKFLDQAGVSTLWTRIAEEVAKEKTRQIYRNSHFWRIWCFFCSDYSI